MTYRTFLFDLDGTLLDSVELIVSSHRHTRRVHFGDAVPDDWIIGQMGRTLEDIYRDMAGSAEAAAPMIETYRTHTHAHHDKMVSAYPDMRETISALAVRPVTLAVVTSKRHALARRGLRITGLEEKFSVVVGADDVVRGKPDPEAVTKALGLLGASSEGAVMIGDSVHDIEAGRRAGIRTAAVLWGPSSRETLARAKPDHFVATVRELLDLT